MIPFSHLNNNKLEMGLYIVSTPIGNLSDITLRALYVLSKSDYILCEDTRVSKKLLEKYDIKSKLVSNHKFNEKSNLNKTIELLKNNKIISLISDAGTPCISDPGLLIVKECIQKKIKIFSVPGASAVSAAMSVSGFDEKYFFYGFFPEKNKDIEDTFDKLSELGSAIVFFISAKKFKKKIPILIKYFSDRSIVLCKEITKLYEEYIRLNINELDNASLELRGEITMVLSPKKTIVEKGLSEKDKKKIKKLIKNYSIKDIVEIINKNKKISKKEIYDFCLTIKNEK